MNGLNYNERSWAIDVVSEINLYLASRSKKIKKATGEITITGGDTSLFPDVILYGDEIQGEVLQGWELKMPDTAINDRDFIDNATEKANRLSLNSFLLWNATSTVLYKRDDNSDFQLHKIWTDIDINSRGEVQEKSSIWKEHLHQLIEELSQYFDTGELSLTPFIESFSVDSFIQTILQNTGATRNNLRANISRNQRLDASINLWWTSAQSEYPNESDKYKVLSRIILTDWVFKILFCHIIKRYFDQARAIENIVHGTSITQAIDCLNEIIQSCNFWNIFNINTGQDLISDGAWNQLIQFNEFFTGFNLESVESHALKQLLESSVIAAKRKVAGQYTTPVKLAEFLSRLTIEDKSRTIIDPCCGTGTIVNSAYRLLKEYGISDDNIESNLWASDKFTFPIQLATMSLTKPDDSGRILKIFNHDVINLETNDSITFKDPNNGNEILLELPEFGYVISNLPFIKQNQIRILNPEIYEIIDWINHQITSEIELSRRSDLFVFLPFYLWRLLASDGKIGIILSNAYLGTSYGMTFLEILQWFYDIENIIISGNGRWFANAEVVTTILKARKKETPSAPNNNSNILFSVTNKSLDDIENIQGLVDNIVVKNDTVDVSHNEYTLGQIREFHNFGFLWSTLFADISWFEVVQDRFISVKDLFNIRRGERRGWNPMFYPADGHGIENDYIKPVLKNLRNTSGLISSPNKIAFCCSKSIEELEELGHTGALDWIRTFENQNNKTGEPLTVSLKRPGMFWYEMRTDTLADFVANINYHDSLFISHIESRAFVDQRLIGLTGKEGIENYDNKLLLALMNSVMSMFFIEALGFGRGLGALDLNKDKFEDYYQFLNPELLNEQQQNEVLIAFEPILARDRLPLKQELSMEDRIEFEQVVFRSFNIANIYPMVVRSLLTLFEIRFAARDS